jgi:hypothetical protein
MVSKNAMFILYFLKVLTDSRVEWGHTNIDSRDTKYRQKGHRDTDKSVKRAGTQRSTDTDRTDIQRRSTGTRTYRIYHINFSAEFEEIQYGRIKLIRVSSFIFHCKYAKVYAKRASVCFFSVAAQLFEFGFI